MAEFTLEQFGQGADVTRNPSLLPTGFARQSVNMLHNRGKNRAKVRAGTKRLNHTRLASQTTAALGLTEYLSELVQRIADSVQQLGATNTAIKTGLTGTGLVKFQQFLRYLVMTDNRTVCNWLFTLSAGVPYGCAQPTTAIVASAGAAGVLTGSYTYSYARYAPLTGELSQAVALTSTVTLASQKGSVAITGIAATEQFTHVRIFRTEVGGSEFFVLADVAVGALPYTDNTADDDLTELSDIHDENGATITSRMEAAFDVCLHRSRLHFINFNTTGQGSRQRWTMPLSFNSESTTDARHDVDADDGDDLRRVFSIDSTLALFKDHSIHLMNGDMHQESFTWQVAQGCDKDAGIGAYCPWTAVSTPMGIIFMAECGIYVWRPTFDRPQLISDPIADIIETANYVYRLKFCAGYNPCEKLYIISFATGANTTNDQTWAFSIESVTWSEWDRGFDPSMYGQAHDASERLKLWVCDQIGFTYETDATNGADGPISGTITGTVTSGSDATHINDSTAAFYTTGDKLIGIPVTIEKSGPLFETQYISSNTGTQLTTSAFASAPATGDTYYIGALQATIAFGRLDMNLAGDKFFQALNVNMEKLNTTVRLQVGYTIDGDDEPTYFEAFLQNQGFRISIPIERYGVAISPWFRVIGVNINFELIKVTVEYLPLGTKMPKVGTHE